uniref:DUF1440 domain-containing protein n=1 Tax=Thermosporothrix sp. COM3 TaxID=2490863 RepID=A0A455SLU7_9CHLR|nr:hypothetical protein KTC_30120 [Thermosporothrix sp. COM3]
MMHDNRSVSWRQGAISGCAGTAPMTIFMLLTQRLLPEGEQYALPPELITRDISRRLHLKLHWNKQLLLLATLISHFGYGATMGALYRLFSNRVALPAALKGTLFGLLIWGASYLVWMPLLGITPAAQREPGRRNALMIAAHVVWGATTGLLATCLKSRQAQERR